MISVSRIILSLAATSLFVLATLGQSVGDKFYLRHSLIFFDGETPKITRDNIVFTDIEICGFSGRPYASPILRRGDEVKIVRVEKKTDEALVVFEADRREYTVSLANSSKRFFNDAFNLGFSGKKEKFGYGGAKSWRGVIKKYGLPIAKCNGAWFYIMEFSPACPGDGCAIQVSKEGITVEWEYI